MCVAKPPKKTAIARKHIAISQPNSAFEREYSSARPYPRPHQMAQAKKATASPSSPHTCELTPPTGLVEVEAPGEAIEQPGDNHQAADDDDYRVSQAHLSLL